MGAEEEADNNVVGEADGEKEYEVEFWIYRNDDYDDDQVTVIAIIIIIIMNFSYVIFLIF